MSTDQPGGPPEEGSPASDSADERGDSAAVRIPEDSNAALRHLIARDPRKTRYRITGEVARGGMGAILRVWDEDLRRNLAMKVVISRGAGDEDEQPTAAEVDPKTLGRFMEEAQITAQLDHPGIVPVHDIGVDDTGHVYFTMQLVRGRDLKEVFGLVQREEEGWSITRALSVMLRVCDAMDYAHSKDVIHRDLKPANVMVGRFGEVYVMDWGLAHVRGTEDAHDLRLQKETTDLSLIATDRADEVRGVESPDEALYTMDGDIVGTPAYMSPEQALGKVGKLDARSDVYSFGAMLYHLLGGSSPFVPDGAKVSQYMILMRVLEGPPRPLHELAPDVPAELAAICEKAMARRPEDRYARMHEVAEDLRAYLEGRVVQAHRTGAVAELRKWIKRNRGLAAAIVALVLASIGGLGGMSYVQARGRKEADVQRGIAEENERIANVNAEEAHRKHAHVLRLSAMQKLEELQAEARDLWPAVPERSEEYEAWLARARTLVAGLHPDPADDDAGHYAQRAELRARAIPRTHAQIEQDRGEHPRSAQLLALEAERRSLEPVTEVEVPALDSATLLQPFAKLNKAAWSLVDPVRSEHGPEAQGLALARLALERSGDGAERAAAGDTLAWALLANGLHDQAVAASREALAAAPADEAEVFQGYLARLEARVETARGPIGRARLAAVGAEIATLQDLLAEPRTWTFADDQDRWWHNQLDTLVTEIEAFADPAAGLIEGVSERWGWGVDRRLRFALEVEERTRTGGPARQAWERAIASIADPAECPRYGGLALAPQLGLLPIGRDSRSGLWEFVHPLTGNAPSRDADGEFVMTEDTGLVLVLIPGGTFDQGAQAGDPLGPNFDPAAGPDEGPVHAVELAPYFLSKFEMTQGQWLRFTGRNPSRYDPTKAQQGRQINLLHPVELVSWNDCFEVLTHMGLQVPTEAQWERAARGESPSAWWTGDERESLVGAVNLADATAAAGGANWSAIEDWPDLEDGWVVHAPVGRFRPNPFGLHDIHGNVREWCREGFAPYDNDVAPEDGERLDTGTGNRVFRGGSYSTTAGRGRSAYRGRYPVDTRNTDLGLRPARSVE
ncbi:MAG: SUMF1/EgtB/PvdO family nonheme iron enzyme [bacterium]|nr:SUMF1/EgtB/PvdO family nonheme iron enzyme [bacterium]